MIKEGEWYMKRLTATVLATAILLAASGCAQSGEPAQDMDQAQDASPAEVADQVEPDASAAAPSPPEPSDYDDSESYMAALEDYLNEWAIDADASLSALAEALAASGLTIEDILN